MSILERKIKPKGKNQRIGMFRSAKAVKKSMSSADISKGSYVFTSSRSEKEKETYKLPALIWSMLKKCERDKCFVYNSERSCFYAKRNENNNTNIKKGNHYSFYCLLQRDYLFKSVQAMVQYLEKWMDEIEVVQLGLHLVPLYNNLFLLKMEREKHSEVLIKDGEGNRVLNPIFEEIRKTIQDIEKIWASIKKNSKKKINKVGVQSDGILCEALGLDDSHEMFQKGMAVDNSFYTHDDIKEEEEERSQQLAESLSGALKKKKKRQPTHVLKKKPYYKAYYRRLKEKRLAKEKKKQQKIIEKWVKPSTRDIIKRAGEAEEPKKITLKRKKTQKDK